MIILKTRERVKIRTIHHPSGDVTCGEAVVEIQVLEHSENYLKFVIRGVTPAFANALRRTILTEVKSLAIDEIIVIENTSVMYDEIIAHRLGLVPLKLDITTYRILEDCQCEGEGCALCEISLSLRAECTEDEALEQKFVFSGDLMSTHEGVEPVFKDIPILRLARGQMVEIEAKARLGKGKDHAKWQPVATVSYKYYPHVEFNENRILCTCHEVCPVGILKPDDDLGIICTDETKCTLCQLCVETCEAKAISIKTTGDEFIFQIEGTGTLPVEFILHEALQLIKKKANALIKTIQNEEP